MASRTDTIVKARFSRGGETALKLAKEHLRYAVHRANDRGQRQYRDLWDRAGQLDKATAYARLDQVKPDDHIYRFTLSPHPERQDAGQQLDLRSWTREMLAQLERQAGQRLEWFAVTHAHRDHRHVHAVVVSNRHLNASQFLSMRAAGDASARAQQRQHQLQPQSDTGRPALPRDRDVAPAARSARGREVGR